MMDFLRNIVSIEWWQELLSTLTFADLEARWELIQQAIANPQQNPLIALLALAIILVFFLIIILTLAMWYFARVQKQHQTFELLDEEENVIQTVDKETAEDILDDARGVETKTKINYVGVLTAMVAVVAVTVGFGVGTQSTTYCTACHNSPHEAVAEWPLVAAHDEVSCVSCHEPGGVLQSVTLNVFPRAAHSIYGIFQDPGDRDATNRTAYGSVTQASCAGCHNSDMFERTLIIERPDRVTVRVSHYEPLEAGMSCAQCHIFSENQERQLIQTGMQTCVSCHNGSRASVACVSCHMADSPADTIQREMGSVWSRQLIHTSPDSSCYDCHDTRSCDTCHGTRVPHTTDYMMLTHNTPNSEMIHAYDYWRIGDMCYNCHFYDNASAAGPCSNCHGGDYVPPPRRYLTPRQELLRGDHGPLPEGMRGPVASPFDPTPRRQLTPAQQQILRDNNIDLSLP